MSAREGRYYVVHVDDPYEHYWEWHVMDRERAETIAICGLVLHADIIAQELNRGD